MIMTKRKAVKIILIVASVIIILFFALFGSLIYFLEYAVSTVDKSRSPDGQYTLLLQSVGSPIFFGPADGQLILKDGGKKIAKQKFTLHDDGGSIRPSIWAVTWEDDQATILIYGSEQAAELITIHFDGTSESGLLPSLNPDSTADSEDPSDTEDLFEEDHSLDEIIPEGYLAVYNTYFAEQGYGFEEDYNAKGSTMFRLTGENLPSGYLLYDRESANGECSLYVYYNGYPTAMNTNILDTYAYIHNDGSVVSSGKKHWQDTGSKEYQDAAGEP